MSKTSTVTLSDEQFAEMFDVSLLKSQQPADASALTAEQTTIIAGTDSKSVKIRRLLATGMKRGAVAKSLGIRYQHVRNVEITPIKRAS